MKDRVQANSAAPVLPAIPEGSEAVSLQGEPLLRPQPEAKDKLEPLLEAAQREYVASPQSVDAAVWVGRRLAYLGRYREAIEWYSAALARHGDEPKLLRHRGHRWLTIRCIEEARADFEPAPRLLDTKPDEVEPDGIPNSRNQPISSLHSNVWYHLALAEFLLRQDEQALAASEAGRRVSTNPDRLVSQTYWQYLILRRLGRESEAKAILDPIIESLDIVENYAYLRLLLVYKGLASEEEVLLGATGEIEMPTLAYGLGMRALFDGNAVKAKVLFERATSGPAWPAFGFLAAEAELARTSSSSHSP